MEQTFEIRTEPSHIQNVSKVVRRQPRAQGLKPIAQEGRKIGYIRHDPGVGYWTWVLGSQANRLSVDFWSHREFFATEQEALEAVELGFQNGRPPEAIPPRPLKQPS